MNNEYSKKATRLPSLILTCLLLLFSNNLHSHNIGVAVVATGKYIRFIPNLVDSINHYFCPDHNVTIYFFSDSEDCELPDNVVWTYHAHLEWPQTSMSRYNAYDSNKDLFQSEDYVFAIDADMLIVDTVGDEILEDHVAVTHFAYLKSRGTYETNPRSTAYMAPNEGINYVRGGFYGGSKARFLHICETCIANIKIDSDAGIVAAWHDESHYNRYCWDHTPSLILNHSYCYPESGKCKALPKKIVALDKHDTQRLRE